MRCRRYPPEDRPAVEVRHGDGTWCPGELHAWLPERRRRRWTAAVAYRRGPGLQHYCVVPAEDVRPRRVPACERRDQPRKVEPA